jgi:hypothetical protein
MVKAHLLHGKPVLAGPHALSEASFSSPKSKVNSVVVPFEAVTLSTPCGQACAAFPFQRSTFIVLFSLFGHCSPILHASFSDMDADLQGGCLAGPYRLDACRLQL